ncbi:hypothetical protein [Tautonia plasticadhaerens]|uniref:Uncharacterized protein n=1 Tax=Tautonia plasticadhaerens TaxID=2527974 RepID=A0A518HAD7_9BACT|nr:hypothetical protein [Tautonia plasticadhaerens]QDV37716.1 hypothetical protein ElP_56590 [Tautonia plasticadhaerens]
MNNHHLLLNDVTRILRLKPHRIAYAIATGQIDEPALRIANKRVFAEEDVRRLAVHFRVTPRWPSPDPATEDSDQVDRHEGLVLKPPFEVRSTGESAHEVRDGAGEVYCWAADRARALIVAGLLESAVKA